jgi:hypothetical protein
VVPWIMRGREKFAIKVVLQIMPKKSWDKEWIKNQNLMIFFQIYIRFENEKILYYVVLNLI